MIINDHSDNFCYFRFFFFISTISFSPLFIRYCLSTINDLSILTVFCFMQPPSLMSQVIVNRARSRVKKKQVIISDRWLSGKESTPRCCVINQLFNAIYKPLKAYFITASPIKRLRLFLLLFIVTHTCLCLLISTFICR